MPWLSYGSLGHKPGDSHGSCVGNMLPPVWQGIQPGRWSEIDCSPGRLMQALPQDGEMVAVFANEVQVTAAIQPHVQEVGIAAINGSHRYFWERSGSPGSVRS